MVHDSLVYPIHISNIYIYTVDILESLNESLQTQDLGELAKHGDVRRCNVAPPPDKSWFINPMNTIRSYKMLQDVIRSYKTL